MCSRQRGSLPAAHCLRLLLLLLLLLLAFGLCGVRRVLPLLPGGARAATEEPPVEVSAII